LNVSDGLRGHLGFQFPHPRPECRVVLLKQCNLCHVTGRTSTGLKVMDVPPKWPWQCVDEIGVRDDLFISMRCTVRATH
jgi:hypothetical protein